MIPTNTEWILSFSTQVHQKLMISWRFFLQTCASELRVRSNSSEPLYFNQHFYLLLHNFGRFRLNSANPLFLKPCSSSHMWVNYLPPKKCCIRCRSWNTSPINRYAYLSDEPYFFVNTLITNVRAKLVSLCFSQYKNGWSPCLLPKILQWHSTRRYALFLQLQSPVTLEADILLLLQGRYVDCVGTYKACCSIAAQIVNIEC
jgi:hypothetical protein